MRGLHRNDILMRSETARIGIITFADQVVVSATNFLTGVIVGRVCTKEEFGLYILGLSIVLFLMDIQNCLVSTPYTMFSPRIKGKNQAHYLGSTLVAQLIISLIAIIFLSVAISIFLAGVGPGGMAAVLWAITGAITFILLREQARRISFAHFHMAKALSLDIFVAIFQIGCLILFAYLDGLSTVLVYMVAGLACSIGAFAWIISIRKTIKIQLEEVLSCVRENWSFGRWLFIGSFMYMASTQLYPWLLTGFHGIFATSEFGASMSVTLLANPFLLALANFLGPKLAHTYTTCGNK